MEKGSDRTEEGSPVADVQPIGHRPVIVEDMVFHVGEDMGMGVSRDTLRIRPNKDLGVLGGGQVVIDAGRRGG